MNILVFTPEYPEDPPVFSSGIGNVVKCLKEELDKRGICVTTCSTLSSDIKLADGSIKKFMDIRAIYVSYFWYRASRYMRDHGDNYDIIWVHDPMPHFLRIYPNNKNIFITYHTIHSNYIYYSKYPKLIYYLIQKYEKYSMKRISNRYRFIAVSNKILEELIELGVEPNRIKYIPNGVNVDMFKKSNDMIKIRKKLNLPQNDTILLSVGKLKEQKRPMKLVDVFSIIEAELEHVTLVIIGRGHLSEKMKQHAEKLQIKNILFLGYVDSLPEYYAAADYYITTTIYEGQPLTLLEAMSSGLPCIVSDIPNLEIVKEADCGIILNYDDSYSSAKEIIEYISKDNFQHGENARNYCLRKASWKCIADEYLSEFNSSSF